MPRLPALQDLLQLSNRQGTYLLLFLSCIVLFFFTVDQGLWRFSHGAPQPASEASRPPSQHTVSTSFDGTWDFQRDRKNLLLSHDQCDAVFPDLYADIDRVVGDRNGRTITLEEIDSIEPMNGYVRALLYEQQLYVVATTGRIYSRGLATLLAINRAITTSPEPLPNIEFTFNVDDRLPNIPQWALARNISDKRTWLMPDFAFWSWPETKVGSYSEVQEKALQMEDGVDNPTGKAWTWAEKIPKMLWRGATMGLPLREVLIEITAGKPWADVKALDWHDEGSMTADLKTMDEHCQYRYLINTAGNSYSGRLKYLQNCRSLILMHEDEWVTHHTHLMKHDGPEQNYVKVRRDFADLEETMLALQRDDEMAQQIAGNNVRAMRERYLTPAAEVCYWRRLIRSWASISFEPEFWKTENGTRKWRGLPIESYALERRLEWDPY